MMRTNMLGYDKEKGVLFILKSLAPLFPQETNMPFYVSQMVDGHINYLHTCGALEEDGDTGEGEYDEEDAFEDILEYLESVNAQENLMFPTIIDAFLPLQDEFMFQSGLLSF